MLKGNSFSRDSDGERTERLVALSANIGDVAVELGLPAAKVTAAEAAQTEWDTDLSAATREGGEAQEATEELNKVIKEAYEYYVAAKAHLKAVISEIEYPDKIITAYGFDDDAPTDFKGLHNALRVWIDEHAVLASAGDPRIVNDTIIGILTTHFATLDEFHRSRLDEKDEAIRATETKRATFVRHSKLMSHIHTLACLTWGDDASQLRLIGMVPSSEIWTEGQPIPGTPVHPEAGTFVATYLGQDIVELVYGAVVGAIKGTLRRRRTGNMNWEIVAKGLPMDDANRVPFRDTHVEQGEYEYEFVSYNEANEPSLPSYSTVTVPEEIPR